MAVSAVVNMKARITETLTQDGASSPQIVYGVYGTSGEVWESTTTSHPVTKTSSDSIALVAGAKTIDLTALVGTNGAAVDGTGLKVQWVYMENPSTNANNMTFVKGASNGYELFADAAWKVTLKPGQSFAAILYNTSPAVGPSAKTIDVTGTTTQSFIFQVLLG